MSKLFTVATQKKTLSDVLISEAHPDTSKANKPFAAGAIYLLGEVLAITDGKCCKFVPGANDATGVPRAVARQDVDASAGDTQGMVCMRNTALRAPGIVWPAGITAPQQTAAVWALEDVYGLVIKAAE
jgi:hypothetical protein